jgi:hypothetical protein
LLAFAYLAQASQTKYGLILTGLITQQSLRNEQYPKTITEANNVLSNLKFDITRSTNKNPNKNLNDQAKREPEQESINLTFAHLEEVISTKNRYILYKHYNKQKSTKVLKLLFREFFSFLHSL